MKLAELDPQWLLFEGRRVGFIFRSPIKREWWQSCFVEPFYLFKGRDGTYPRSRRDDDWSSAHDSQCGIITASYPDAGSNWQGCEHDCQWSVAGGIEAADFDTITVTPSLDGSRGGLWHGFVTNGEIVGGI